MVKNIFLLLIAFASISFGSGATRISGGDTLSALSCTTNQIPKWNGSQWACAADSGAGAIAWGDLSGTLSNQSDLNTALGLKAPIANPTFTGTATGTFSGNITGNVTGNASGTAATFTGNLTGDVTSSGMATTLATVTVAKGGTGLTTLTDKNVILGAGSGNVTFVAPGTSGNVLTSNGTTWTSAAASGGLTTPGTTVSTDLVTWSGTTGAAVADGGVKLRTVGTGNTINFMIGNAGGLGTTTGTGNVIIGNSGQTVDTGASNNVLIGTNTAAVGTTGEAIAVGPNAGNGATGSADYSISIGSSAGNAGANSINLGYKAGRYDNTASALYIDGLDRTNQSGNQTKSIIYGLMNATVSSQTLTFNATTQIGQTGSTPQHKLNTATASAGSCGSLAAACVDISINGVQHFIPYF